MVMREQKIAIVGVGPGSLDYLTPIGRARVEGANVLVGARRLLELFPEFAGESVSLDGGIESALDAIEAAHNRRVTVVVSGDPGLMSLGAQVIRRFGRAKCEVIAGVSSLQLAFARLGLSWYDVRILNAHGKVPLIEPAVLRAEKKIAILTGSKKAQTWLQDLGTELRTTHDVVVARDLSLEGETIFCVDVDSLPNIETPRTIVLFLSKELCLCP